MNQITDVCRFSRASSISTAGVIRCPVVVSFCEQAWPQVWSFTSVVGAVKTPTRPRTPQVSSAAGIARASDAKAPNTVTSGNADRAALRPVEPAKAALRISPESYTIAADDPGLQLLAARNENGKVRDLTSQAKWTIDPPGMVELEPGGYLRPARPGVVTVTAALEGQAATARITLEPRSTRSWDFAEDIVPIFTRLGCNTGACHGKADGQNGFHLSLFGYDRAGDFQALARDGGHAGGRDWFPKQVFSSPRQREQYPTAEGGD